uniref:Uncharacterized protein n=1 Tax=Rhizophora mucronata TaxID=61149 RepID=A0A2P2IYK6_RHIMU
MKGKFGVDPLMLLFSFFRTVLT